METIVWTPEKRDALRKAHEHAVHFGMTQFMFDGHEFVTAYTKYLLEYLDQRMPTQPRRTYARSRGGR